MGTHDNVTKRNSSASRSLRWRRREGYHVSRLCNYDYFAYILECGCFARRYTFFDSNLSLESLSRYLRYLSIEETTPLMPTDALLTRMAKQGYIEKVRDMVTGEPRFDYHLGPRGKIEVGKKGTMEFISRVCFARLSTNGRYTGMI